MFHTLAFVPNADILDAFENLSEDFLTSRCQLRIDYFEDRFTDHPRPYGQSAALSLELKVGMCSFSVFKIFQAQ